MGRYWNDKRLVRATCTLILLGIAGYGAWLRFHDLGLSLYDDEISTRERAQQSVLYTLETRNYPLYYLLAKTSLSLGDTEVALRLPSFLAGVASIFAAFGLVKRVHSRSAGLVAAALIAFSPFHIYYSTFARYYALMMLFALLTLWALFAILEGSRARHWIAYTVSAFLALASHVCFAPALAMMNVVAALYLLFNPARGSLRKRVALICLLALCTTAASGLLIQKNLHPGRIFQKLAPATEARVAYDAPVASTAVPAVQSDSKVEARGEVQRPLGSGQESVDPATGETRYRLTFYDCMEYLKTFFWNDTTWLWPLLLALGIFGLVDLWFRVPAIAAPLTGGLLLAPLPLFAFTTEHWYHVRYLSYGAVFAVVLVACGVCVLPRFLARLLTAPRSIRLWKRIPEPAPQRQLNSTSLLYGTFVVALAIPMAPVLNDAYNRYPVDGYLPRGPLVENRAPIRDWKNLNRFTAPYVRDGDYFLFMTPEGEHGLEYTRYYQSRFQPWNEEEVHFQSSYGPPTPEILRQLAQDNPTANLWFIGFQNYNVRDFAPLLEAAGASQLDLSQRNIPKGLRLFFLGAPASNYVSNGSFEGRIREDLPEGIERDPGAGYGSAAALKISLTREETEGQRYWQRMYRARVNPASYRLRNPAFEAWHDGTPTGWTANTVAPLAPADGTIENTHCLKIASATETTILQQSIPVGLAPGHTLAVQVMGRSATADNLQLVLRYAGPGFQEERRASHPGTGTWEKMNLEAAIPATADPNSITVELWRTPGGDGDAFVDNVELHVTDSGASLDPATTYVLSLAVRADSLHHQSGAEMTPAGRVRLNWTDRDGTQGFTNLMNIHSDETWRLLTATFQPGKDLPANLKDLYLEAGISDGTGTIYIDQIQLEEGTQPTPFTLVPRLPHDETIGRNALEPHAVQVSW
jgi:hypothetical protein